MIDPSLRPTEPASPPPRPFSVWPLYLCLGIFFAWATAHHLGIDFQALLWGVDDMTEYMRRFGKPEFVNFPRTAVLMAETLSMALWGTSVAMVLAFILAPLAAKNLSPHPILYRFSRELLNGLRALPDLLFASIFVAALGLGINLPLRSVNQELGVALEKSSRNSGISFVRYYQEAFYDS